MTGKSDVGVRGVRRGIRSLLATCAALAGVAVSLVLAAAPAAAHSYAATVFADVTEPERGIVRTVLDLEYVLLATDGAREMSDASFEQAAYLDVQASGRDPEKLTTAVLEEHSATVDGYVLPRFEVGPVPETGSVFEACDSRRGAPYEIVHRDGVPHVRLVIEADCTDRVEAMPAAYQVTTALFPGTAPGGKTTTIVTYDVRSGGGVAHLDTDTNPSMTTTKDWGSRMGEFFVLGAEHLLLGPDHLLFLLALVVGSRRLRDIVLAATAFTIAHSVTFILAAMGVVSIPAEVVEPVIAISIAIVALWEIRRYWLARRAGAVGQLSGSPLEGSVERIPRGSRAAGASTALLERAPAATVMETKDVAEPGAGFTRADLVRVAVIFAFGLMHGVGFAGALGIDEPFSWSLLGALLVFNVGIEVAQLAVIAVVFPLYAFARRRIRSIGFWIAGAVALVGLFWFVERILGLG